MINKKAYVPIALLTLISCFVFSSHSVYASNSHGGSGTENDPILIGDCEQLQYMFDNYGPNPNFYKIINDIDCSGTAISDPSDPNYDLYLYNDGAGFVPLGADKNFDPSQSGFTGVIDGNHKTIYGLSMNRPDSGNFGDGFISAAVNSYIYNLNFSGGTIIGGDYVGSLAGITENTIVAGVNSVGMTIIGSSTNNEIFESVGGLVGVTVSDPSPFPSIQRSSAGNMVSSIGISQQMVGGLIGFLFASSTIDDSYSTSTVTGGVYSGGLVGAIDGAFIINSYSSGPINGETLTSGGLVGAIVDDNNFGGGVISNISESFTVSPVNTNSMAVGGCCRSDI